MVKELFDEERHTLTDYGHEKFMSYFETRTPEALLKLLQKSIPATPTPWMYQDPLVRGVMKQVAQEDVSNKKGEESLPWPNKEMEKVTLGYKQRQGRWKLSSELFI